MVAKNEFKRKSKDNNLNKIIISNKQLYSTELQLMEDKIGTIV